ncbi:hypothetical protein J8L86_14615 [Shewanella sp. MMG014]|uniref:hypothetical protein n=1 Tax=Shewanella sp. MMG014 TaxID=2822691 RepID=UPI001B395EB9|nr:hypothetical protein [Shewanella sp. MMG014]MBQ4891086.1 hypothetical protein [Shewanella sp. MMG014]
MACDFYFDSNYECIEHHEESFFSFVTDGLPQLQKLKANFYRDPGFTNEECNSMVHELISIRAEIIKTKETAYIAKVLDRLILFFSTAYIGQFSVRTVSD